MDLITHGRRNAGILKELQKRKEEISASQDRRSAFEVDKRLTAGTLWRSNGCCLNEDVLNERRRRDDKLFQQNMDSMAKTAEKHQRRLRAYEALVREGDHNKETVQVLKLWLQVRVKPKTDGVKIPGTRPKLLELKAKIALRNPLTLKEYLIDAKPKDEALVALYLESLEEQPAEGEANVVLEGDSTMRRVNV